MFKFTKEQLSELKSHQDKIRGIEGNNNYPLTPELLKQLCNRFLQSLQHFPKSVDSLFEEPYIGACGCLGPRDGELYCNCTMNNLQFKYRYDIALEILN